MKPQDTATSSQSNTDPNPDSASKAGAQEPKRVVIKTKASAVNQASKPSKGHGSSSEIETSSVSADHSKHRQGDKSEASVGNHRWVLNDLAFLAAVGLSCYLVLIFAGYDPRDPGFVLVDNPSKEIANYGGQTGAWLSSLLLYIFGFFGYLLPLGITIAGWATLKHPLRTPRVNLEQDYTRFMLGIFGVGLLVSAGAAMSSLFMDPNLWSTELPYTSGGAWGYFLSDLLINLIDLLATTLLLLGLLAWSLSLILNRSWMNIFELTGEATENLVLWVYQRVIKGQKSRQLFELTRLKMQPKTSVKSNVSPVAPKNPNFGEHETLSGRIGMFFQHLFKGPRLQTKPHSTPHSAAMDATHHKDFGPQSVQQTIDPNEAKRAVSEPEGPVIQSTAPRGSPEPQIAALKARAQPSQTAIQTPSQKAPNPAEVPQGSVDKELTQKPDLTASTGQEAVVENPDVKTPDSAHAFSVEVGQRVQALPAGEIYQKAELPSLELLAEPPDYEEGYTEEELTDLSFKLEQSLDQFGIKVSVESVQPGPVVTRFEILPAPGIKVSKINNLSKDLARVMMVESVRVVDVIVGKSVIGIEIPNKIREVVSFREVLSSNAFQDSKSALTIALGKDISGEPIVADIAKMPHLLVAGTTGAGKSVGVNSMILSMLFKSTAQEVRMILIDPKMLELSIYEDIPHLLSPVVTDMNDAANALRWCVFEMDRRYELMSKLKVRNMAGFNAKVKAAIEKGQPLIDPLHEQLKSYGYEMGEAPPTLEPLPNIVVVIDEFADMIMTVGKEVEQLIARLAQKARAAGIHLILATQRPSVNVITGLIKANIPTRIAFMVNTKIDSRTILEQGGAEQLLGKGDMLYMPPGSGTPVRVHGAFMSDEEVNEVAEFVKSQGEPQYIKAITEAPPSEEDAKGGTASAEEDPLYDEVVAFITEKRKVSVSLLQRHFSIGYNRSARIVEGLEAAGLVSSGRGGNNVREVLVPRRDDPEP